MAVTLKDIVPEVFYFDDPDYVIRPYLQAFEEFEEDVLKPAIEGMPELVNIDLTREIGLFLKNLGNPFEFILTEDKQRRLAHSLAGIYKSKGTAEGIRLAILFFTGEEANIIETCVDGTEFSWVLGVSELGVDTYLNASPETVELFTFFVDFQPTIDPEVLSQIEDIIEFMKPAWTCAVVRDGILPDTFPAIDGFEDVSWEAP